MRRLDLKHVIAQSHDVRHRLHLELLRDLEERADLPLLVLPRQLLLVLGPCRYDLDVWVQAEQVRGAWHELGSTELDPALSRVRDY